MDEHAARKILEKNSLGKLRSFNKCDQGITGGVFHINGMIIKISRDRTEPLRLRKSKFIIGLLKENSINAPDCIALDTSKEIIGEDYIIMSKMGGELLSDKWDGLSEEEQKRACYEVGKLIAQFHKIKLDKFGDPIDTRDQEERWKDWTEKKWKMYHDYVKQKNIIPDEVMEKVEKFFEDNKALLDVDATPVLVHNDIQAKNIFVKESHVDSIIDFDECIGGHNEFDFIKLCLPFKKTKRYLDETLRGYQEEHELNDDFPERIKLYMIIFGMNVLRFVHTNNIPSKDLIKKWVWTFEKIIDEDWKFYEFPDDLKLDS